MLKLPYNTYNYRKNETFIIFFYESIKMCFILINVLTVKEIHITIIEKMIEMIMM